MPFSAAGSTHSSNAGNAAGSLQTIDRSYLGEDIIQTVFPGAVADGRTGNWGLYRQGRWLLGLASVAPGGDLEAAAGDVYAGLLSACRDWNLCRIWNYVPCINAAGPDGLENYRAFSCGRSVAFEREFGAGFKRRLPAASAVGTEGERLVVAFAASRATPCHHENPDQVPAYDYPQAHGPRPPAFSRATVVPDGTLADVFVSGTSAIKGHETLAPGDTLTQLAHTLENLRVISRVAGLGDDLGAGRCATRHFSVYLRHAGDFPAVRDALAGQLVRPGDVVGYLRADICRAELNVEIEATVLGATGCRVA